MWPFMVAFTLLLGSMGNELLLPSQPSPDVLAAVLLTQEQSLTRHLALAHYQASDF